jgi:hypothetical protein
MLLIAWNQRRSLLWRVLLYGWATDDEFETLLPTIASRQQVKVMGALRAAT